MNLNIFDKIRNNFKVNDNRYFFSAGNCFEREQLPNLDFFKSLLSSIPKYDSLKIELSDDSGDILKIFPSLTSQEFEKFLCNTDQVDVRIEVEKKVSRDILSIYDFNSFLKNLLNLSNYEFLHFFSDVLDDTKHLVINVYDSSFKGKLYGTKSITFRYYLDELPKFEFNRNNRLQKVQFTSNFYNFHEIKLIPDDFHVISNSFDEELRKRFNKYETVFSEIHLATFSVIKDKKIHLSSLTTKIISEEKEILDVRYKDELFEIYNWIFSEENYMDKLSILRNIIDTQDFNFDDCSLSIKSILITYNLYLKENTKEFLEAKNEVGHFIVTTLYDFEQYTDVIVGSLGNNFFALVAFITTTLIANIVSSSPLDNIFTKDVLILLLAILVGSFVYCWISNIKFSSDIGKFNESFKRLKKNYSQVFNENELNKLFDETDLKEVNDKVSKFRLIINVIWVGATFILGIVVVMILYKFYLK
ncbi:hypothetical protein E3305_00085 [Streptococcus equinus]|uniref:hypothetical protein n=1 Tax=Streptococcus equinus TaxID=1335 RepID=UPI00106FB0C9|nr:hypothetical protein [Streptococcus equinus]TFH44640.1 hypothetical protein E3305_00085 [Streptococcus equinus]